MIPKLGYEKSLLFDFIDKQVFVVYASGPITGQSISERFWLSLSFIWSSCDVFYEVIDSFQDVLVCFLPIEVFFPGLGRINDLHSRISFGIPLPSSNSFIDSSKRRALRGLRRRYAVSLSDS